MSLIFMFFIDRLPYWPYVKGTVTVLLVVPYFGGASYVYKCFVRTHPFKVSEIFCLIWNILFIPVRKNFPFNGLNNFVDEIDKNRTVKGQEEQQKPVIFQVLHHMGSSLYLHHVISFCLLSVFGLLEELTYKLMIVLNAVLILCLEIILKVVFNIVTKSKHIMKSYFL